MARKHALILTTLSDYAQTARVMFSCTLTGVVSALCLPACLVTEPPQDLSSTAAALRSENTLSANGLTYNGLTYNGLSQVSLSTTRTDENVLQLNIDSAGGLNETESGRQLLLYSARCALTEGDVLHVQHGAQSWQYPGLFGLAPEWEHGPLSESARIRMTACLLAHVNAFGASVPISVRNSTIPAATGDEAEDYFYGDGAFFGDLYGEQANKYSCKIAANEHLDACTGEMATAWSPDQDLRVCAGPDADELCDIEYTGYCHDVCDVIEVDGNQWRFSQCLGNNGVRYDFAVTVWLSGGAAESCEYAPAGFTCKPD